jgi:hypothetical protein
VPVLCRARRGEPVADDQACGNCQKNPHVAKIKKTFSMNQTLHQNVTRLTDNRKLTFDSGRDR